MELAGKRILLVEDDQDLQEIINVVLVEIGHYEVIASHLKEMYQKLEEGPPDLIVLDCASHRSHPDDLCKGLKVRKMTKNIPVLLVSTHVEVDKIAQEMGANDYLAKPFDVRDLLEKVEKLMSTQHVG